MNVVARLGTGNRTSTAVTGAFRWVPAYICIALILLPIDWFAPTGYVFREFGARPATLLLTIGGLFGLLQRPRDDVHAKFENRVWHCFLALMACNGLAFGVNLLGGFSFVPSARSPWSQFAAQSTLVVAGFITIVGNARLFSRVEAITVVNRYLPAAAAVHLAVWSLEVLFPSVMQGILSPFRSGGISLERATGLHTEPSHYGTMAALFSVPLFLIGGRKHRIRRYLLGAGLLASALFIVAKTAIVVAAAQVAYVVITSKRAKTVPLLLLALLAGGGLYAIQTRAALDVEENLSSAMRLGSSHLAANVAVDGYGLVGVGAGQFHFFYNEANAPAYLLFSEEALEQMSPTASGRASTYNLFLRVLIEFGVTGFLLLVYGLLRLLRAGASAKLLTARLMLVGSLGFLTTQDTYVFPPLMFACAVLLSHQRRFAGGAAPILSTRLGRSIVSPKK